MKKRKIISVVLLFTLVLSAFSAFAVSAENEPNGMKFSNMYYYEATQALGAKPATFEANIFVPSNHSPLEGTGVIFGNYRKDTIPGINFEITALGSPKLSVYMGSDSKSIYNFYDTYIKKGALCNVTITLDYETGEASCYIDGQLKQTIKRTQIPSFYMANSFALGGDFVDANPSYFKGTIQSLVLYSDARTPEEVAADCTANTPNYNDEALLCHFDFSDMTPGAKPEKLVSKTSNEYTFNLKNDTWIMEEEMTHPKDYAYSMAVIGDIQKLTIKYPDKLSCIFDWLVANKESKKIAFAYILGDITDQTTEDEWALTKREIYKLNGVLPYSIVRGNHDKKPEMYTNTFKYSEFFKDAEEGTYGSFDGSTMLTTYQKFTAGGFKYLVINLDYLMSDEILEWAGKLCDDNPDYNVIITTHIYMTYGKTVYDLSSLKEKYGCFNNGDGMWNKLLKKHSNIVLLLCGHNPTDQITLKTDKGEKGNTVQQLLVDPQTTDLNWGGTGLVAMMYFSKTGDHIDVEYYSTVKNAYFKKSNQFDFLIKAIKSESTDTDSTEPESAQPAESSTTDDVQKTGGNSTLIITILASVVIVAAIIVLVFGGKKKTKETENK